MEIAKMTQGAADKAQQEEKNAQAGFDINVGDMERWASGFAGAALGLLGLKRGGLLGLALAGVGGSLLYRGATGKCHLYNALGINTAGANEKGKGVQQGILITKSVVIRKPRAELFRFWRDFTNLPQFMKDLESVECFEGNKSHWVAKGPMNTTLEWDAEIINEVPDELIAWQSLENADVRNAGSVHFTDNLGGETHVKVTMQYLPPAGRLGDKVSKWAGTNPAELLEENLQRFKQLMESGGAQEVSAGSADEGAVGVSGT
ncbi:MAG TPA: SRPBCC family protein [Planctomycetota bacterium]|nr:SRPBCC family protein [Planctomycetota bacterium]